MSTLVFVCGVVVTNASVAAATVVRAGLASISNDPDARTWTISSTGTSLVLRIDGASDFEAVRLSSLSGKSWLVDAQSDSFVKAGSQLPFGNGAAGFVYQDVTTSVHGQTVQLDVTYDLPAARLRATRHYAATSGTTTFETWTTLAGLSGTVSVADLNAFHLVVPAGALHWVTGLQANAATTTTGFTQQQRTLAIGERLTLGGEGRSSEQIVPWFAIDGDGEEFTAGLMWSGAWSLTAARSASGLDLTLGLASMTTTIASPVEGPHAFLGVTRGGLAAAASSLSAFALDGLRGGRRFDALVTYNTWFAYGTHIDESTMMSEIDGAAALGAELFVVDAGWYAGAAQADPADFATGLGTWQVDSSRFPRGLGPLTQYAHDRGLKFGIWIEPERVALATVNQRGLAEESWLAKNGGKYGSSQSAQICFGSPAARQWVIDQITRLIDTVGPDYIKWDNNFWINCDRGGHGHGARDGNFAHVNGVYDVLATLRSRYPNLLIENVSGGGNRLDLGMLRYTDVAWMDDRSAPSSRVRHNIEGLSEVFPPAYLLSFVMEHDAEPLHDAADMALYFRSRMTGTLGLCFRTAGFSDADALQMAGQIDTYKELRRTLRVASATLLTEQADARLGPPWDAMQTSPPGNLDVVVNAFQQDPGAREILVRPVGLRPSTIYLVESVDNGSLGAATGAELMSDGIRIVESATSAAHILVLKPQRRRQ